MKNQCGMSNMEWGMETERLRTMHTLPIQRSTFPIRTGLTLVELLITMAIMAIIAVAILGTAAAAIEGAREKRTQTLVNKIHVLVMEHYASYETRRVEINQALLNQVNTTYSAPSQSRQRGMALAELRLLGTRELMKYEMPDRWTDVINGALNSDPRSTPLSNPTVLASIPPLARTYHQRLMSLNPSSTSGDITNWQGAESLFLFVMNATGDGEARTLFSKQEIGDIDGDGAFEFHDGWGNPISWIRWPSGYGPTPLMSGDYENDHEPADAFRRDMPGTPNIDPGFGGMVSTALTNMRNRTTGAYRLVPLIYSAGSDGLQDITPKGDNFVADLDPYTSKEAGQDAQDVDRLPGTVNVASDGYKDNITNHLIKY